MIARSYPCHSRLLFNIIARRWRPVSPNLILTKQDMVEKQYFRAVNTKIIMPFKDPEFGSLHEFLINSANNIHSPGYLFLFEKVNGRYEGISYKETFENIEKWAAYLYQCGIRKGDKVAVILEN